MLMSPRLSLTATFLVGVTLALLPGPLSAQQQTITVMGPDGKPRTITRPAGAPGGPPGSKPTPAKPGESGKPDKDGDKKAGEDGKKDPPEPKVIRRGDQKPGEADPEELKASVGPDGRVAFQFRNQPWVDLVQWLAEIADQPLDWQELPADRVNLRSPGRYTVEETKDLFNRHLLARGYTLLDLPGGITVAKTAGINPAMVRRVTAEDLQSLPAHTFVRTSLELGWLSSEKLAEELKPMISSNGKLTALTTTNRIEAMDAAINLRQIVALLEQERNQSSRDALAPEFKLRHIPAEVAKKMLEEFLGVEKKSAAPMTPQQMQMMQQMARQNGGKPAPAPKEPEISIVANTRQNSVFIRGPVDRIAIATEFINRIDVPGQGLNSLADIESRVQVYRLYSLDPEKLIEIVSEMNVLEPATRIRTDSDNQAVIVSGSAADRYIIQRLIQRLDGSGRSFEVLQLRRLEATEVAESIEFLMGKSGDDDDDDSSRRFFYYGYGNNDQKDKNKDEFRVAANARFRQVLLWANESEMEQVRNLLIKLGELPPPGGSRSTIRKIDASSSPETYEYLLRLRQQWSQMSNTSLQLPSAGEFVDPIQLDTDADDEDTDSPDTDDTDELSPGLETRNEFPRSDSTGADANKLTLTATGADEASLPPTSPSTPTADPSNAADVKSMQEFDRLFRGRREPTAEATPEGPGGPAEKPPSSPIRIELDDDGNLILLGSDTKELDRLENLMLQVAPPQRPYHVFKIKHQSAGYVRLNLVEYFEDQEDDDNDDYRRYWYYGYDSRSTEDEPSGLAKSAELRFVQDPDTNTIVVTGATSSQLRTISELIKLWDVAEPVNKRRMRYTKLVTVEYGQAEQIAETVKEAYRDLLSSNDKTFAKGGRGNNGNNPGGGGDKSSGRERGGSGLVDSENGRDGGDVDFSFKGKLSMGVDPVGNTLLVSAEGEPLLELVVEMINKLDQAAKPAGDMQVFSLSGNTSEKSIQEALKAFGAQKSGGTNPAVMPQRPQPPGGRRPPEQQPADNG